MKRPITARLVFIVLICTSLLTGFDAKSQNTPSVQHYLDSVRPYINNFRQTDPNGVLDVLYTMEKMNRDSVLMGRIYMAIITTNMQLGHNKLAKDYLLKHRILSQRLNDLESLFYNYSNAGFLFYNLGDYDSAMLYYRKTLNATELLHKSQAVVKLNIGLLYETLGDPNKAIEFYRSSLMEAYDSLRYPNSVDEFNKKETIRVVATVASNILLYSTQVGDTLSAHIGKAYLDSLVTKFKSEIVGTNSLVIHNTLAYSELENLNLSLAKEHAYRLLALSREMGNEYFKLRSIDVITQIALNSRGEVIEYQNANLLMWELGNDLRQRDRVSFNLLRSLLFMRLGIIDSATYYHDKYTVLKKFEGQVLNDVKRRIDNEFNDIELTHKYKEDLVQIEILSKKEDTNYQVLLIVSLSIIILAIVVVLYIVLIRRSV
ncbi:MAG: tetratricopeptide repeat protein [Cyclobacteriaceae bacterium]